MASFDRIGAVKSGKRALQRMQAIGAGMTSGRSSGATKLIILRDFGRESRRSTDQSAWSVMVWDRGGWAA
jgi:hypothetical protein